MIRTGAHYRDSIRDGRRVFVNGERIRDVTTHPMFRPLVDIRARFYDMRHEPATRPIMSFESEGEINAVANKLPRGQDDWWQKRRATNALLEEIGGVVTRVGDETVREMWSLFNGQDVLNEIDARFPATSGTTSLPCLGKYRSEGETVKTAARTRSGYAAACGEGNRCRPRRARREIRDGRRLRPSGVYRIDDRQPGQQRLFGKALFSARQTGLDKQQAVQEKLGELAVYREGINAHLTAAIALAEPSPGGLMMPNQSLLYAGRVLACSRQHHMMHIARELYGGQIRVTPEKGMFDIAETKPWMEKFYPVDEDWVAEDRRKLLALARDPLNRDYAGHRLTFQLFAQSPPFADLAAVYRNFDWDGPLDFVGKSAGLSERVVKGSGRSPSK